MQDLSDFRYFAGDGDRVELFGWDARTMSGRVRRLRSRGTWGGRHVSLREDNVRTVTSSSREGSERLWEGSGCEVRDLGDFRYFAEDGDRSADKKTASPGMEDAAKYIK